tara:strand:- start:175 stop:618 length:444 start_codon:yes stop_codon:yes gene_type:complete
MSVHSLGRVVLKVRILERPVPLNREVLGLKQVGQHGEKMVFFSIVDNHHDLAVLETDNSAMSSLEESLGSHHVAFKIGDSLQQLQKDKDWLVNNGVEPDGARDHVATQSVYFFDPDGNQIELFVEGNPKIWLENPSAVANCNPLELK